MIDIFNVSVLDLLPLSLKQDPDIVAASKSLDKQMVITAKDVEKCIILPNIDSINDHFLLDLLAWETHLDFYDTSLSIETKRELIKKAPSFHRKKGTAAAVEELVATLFDEGEVEEWFEYGSVPFRFQVVTNNQSVTGEKAAEFLLALNSVKRLSAHLERVIIQQKEEMNLYFAGVVHEGTFETIRQVV